MIHINSLDESIYPASGSTVTNPKASDQRYVLSIDSSPTRDRYAEKHERQYEDGYRNT